MHIELINHLTKARLHKLILDADEFALEIFILQYQDAIAENLIFDDYFNTVIDDQYNSTALHLAVLTDNVTILKMVIAAGADPNQQLENDIAAIHLAAFRNKLNALAYLIRIKVNLDLHSLLDDFTAVMYATSANNGDAITLLYDAKANLNERTAEGITAVYIATENDYMESLAALIAGNADVKIPDVHGFAPIHKAAERDNYYALVRLINAGANVNARSNSINGRVTALFIAVNGRHFNSVAVILQSGKAKLNYRYGPQAITALFRAVVLISPEIFSLLLYYNANPFLPAYFHNDELSLRRLVRWMRVNNNSPELQQINSILRSLPKFPAYPESGNFRFESHSNEAPALNNITQGTTLAINHSADTQSDIHASVSLTDISLLSFTNPISRSTSFCTYDSNDLYQFTHTKRNDLGKGSLGSVYLMTPNYLNNTKLAVKEIKPLNIKFSDVEDDEIREILFDTYPTIAREAYINYVMHGIGAMYWDAKPIQYIQRDNVKKLISYPRCYLAMKYFPGKSLDRFIAQLDGEAYLQIFISALVKLKHFHKYFVHCDIKSHNIIVYKTANGRYQSNLIDFSFSRPKGALLTVNKLNLNYQPPEFANKLYIKANPNQDIYNIGFVMEVFYNSRLFSAETANNLRKLFENMQHYIPSRRPDVAECLKVLITLQENHKRVWELLETFTSFANFFKMFADISDESQLKYLNERTPVKTKKQYNQVSETPHVSHFHEPNLVKIKRLITNPHEFLQLYDQIAEQNKPEFINLITGNFILNLDFVKFDVAGNKAIPNLLFHAASLGDIRFCDKLISLLFSPQFSHQSFDNNHPLIAYINNSNRTLGQQAGPVIKMLLASFINRKGIKSCLEFCDNFKNDKTTYKKLLLIVNEVYRERRANDPREYFTFFGEYSKTNKIQASLLLDRLKTENLALDLFALGELNQGNLGTIAKRLRSCV